MNVFVFVCQFLVIFLEYGQKKKCLLTEVNDRVVYPLGNQLEHCVLTQSMTKQNIQCEIN